jgi:hypothetical protein
LISEADDADRRRLTRPIGTQQGEEVPCLHREADALEGLEAITVGLRGCVDGKRLYLTAYQCQGFDRAIDGSRLMGDPISLTPEHSSQGPTLPLNSKVQEGPCATYLQLM